MRLFVICDKSFNNRALLVTELRKIAHKYHIHRVDMNKYYYGARDIFNTNNVKTTSVLACLLDDISYIDVFLIFYEKKSPNIDKVIAYAKSADKLVYLVKYNHIASYKTI